MSGTSKKSSPVALICEDDRSTLEVIANIIRQLGIPCIKAENANFALTILEQNPEIALFITDIGLPDIDGRELIKTVRQTRSAEKLPIIVLSGIIMPNDIAALLDCGANRFLPKPIQRSELIEAISKEYPIQE